MQKPSAILFDLDGTLVDTSHDLTACLNTLREEAGLLPLPYAAVRPYIGTGVKGLIEVGFPETTQATDLSKKFLSVYAKTLNTHSHCFPGVMEVLDFLDEQKISWGIVTNKHRRFAEPLVDHLHLLGRCAVLVCGDTLSVSKPHPAPLLHACQSISSRVEQCIYVGDSESDILAAKAAGMKSVAVGYGYLLTPDDHQHWGADFCIATPMELIELLI